MRDEQRIVQMTEGAAFLRSLPDTLDADTRERLANLAHGIEKFAVLVLDRDAGPTRDVASQCLALETRLAAAEVEAARLLQEASDVRERSKAALMQNAALTEQVKGLSAALAEARKPRAAALPTDPIPEEG